MFSILHFLTAKDKHLWVMSIYFAYSLLLVKFISVFNAPVFFPVPVGVVPEPALQGAAHEAAVGAGRPASRLVPQPAPYAGAPARGDRRGRDDGPRLQLLRR